MADDDPFTVTNAEEIEGKKRLMENVGRAAPEAIRHLDHFYLDKESNGLAHVAARLNGQSFYGQVRLIQGERSELATRTAKLL